MKRTLFLFSIRILFSFILFKGLALNAFSTAVTDEAYQPAILTGIRFDPQQPLQFDFIVDRGDKLLKGRDLKSTSQRLINYFLASLTVPEDEVWVNLSPYEEDRIIASGLGNTEMGRDMLAQDYELKQLSASLMSPENKIGQKIWRKINQHNMSHKVWIVPDKAVVHVHNNSAFVVDSHLRVLLEEDYNALQNKNVGAGSPRPIKKQTQTLRDVLIPAIETKVNQGKTFAPLRQIFHSMILATWYKTNLKKSLLANGYADSNMVSGIALNEDNPAEKIYNQYLNAFSDGVYDMIKEEYDPVAQEIMQTKYFSGGVKGLDAAMLEEQDLDADWLAVKAGRSHVTVSVDAALVALPEFSVNTYIARMQNALYHILNVYANVHRGAGIRSEITTALYEYARQLVLRVDQKDEEHTAVFNNTRNTDLLTDWMDKNGKPYKIYRSKNYMLNMDVNVVVAREEDFPTEPLTPGGGTVYYATAFDQEWATHAADRLEAGTPNIVGNILFAKMLLMSSQAENRFVLSPDREIFSSTDVRAWLYTDEYTEKGLEGRELLEALSDTFYAPEEMGVFVDHGASNISFGLVGQAMDQVLSKRLDQTARVTLVREVEMILRQLINAYADYDVFFSGSTTDASNMLYLSISRDLERLKKEKVRPVAVLGSDAEHNSSRLPYSAKAAQEQGVTYISLGIDKNGFFDEEEFRQTLEDHNLSDDPNKPYIGFIQLSGASNVLGSFNDMKRLVKIAKDVDPNIKFSIDGAQMLAHREVDMADIGADFFFTSFHKTYGSSGAGALVARKGALNFSRAETEQLKKDGSENLMAIAGAGKALNVISRIGLPAIEEHERELSADFDQRIEEEFGGTDLVRKYGDYKDLSRRAAVSAITVKGYAADTVSAWLEEDANVNSREGCFCAATAVFTGAGYGPEYIKSLTDNPLFRSHIQKLGPRMTRFSSGLNNKVEDNERIIASLKRLLERTPNPLEARLAEFDAAAPPLVLTMDMELTTAYAELLEVSKDEVIRLHDNGRGLFVPGKKHREQREKRVQQAIKDVFYDAGKFIADEVFSDDAMLEDTNRVSNNVFTKGGVDFNPASMQLTEKGDAVSVIDSSDNLQSMFKPNVKGIRPVIINMTPVPHFPSLLGIDPSIK